MKKILSILLLGILTLSLQAQSLAERGIAITNVSIVHSENKLYVSMDIDATGVKVRSNQQVVLTPILVDEGISLKLPVVSLTGRSNYYRQLRKAKSQEAMNQVYMQKKNKEVIHYETDVPYQSWMETSLLLIEDSRCGCLNRLVGEKKEETLAEIDFAPRNFLPTYLFITPEASVKTREVCGRAFVDFPVNETVIYPDFRENRRELQKIYQSIDSVRNNPDATITAFSIKGFASPDGPYEGNARLAKGRTKALLDYIQKLYSLPSSILSMDYEAEDWGGLRKFVSESSLSEKDALLRIIDGNLEPDARNWKLKADYPEAYHFLLTVCYPALRHSDYVIDYTVRAYTDIEEARRILKERPGNLSLYEFNMIANSYKEGSEEYEEVFDIMVRVYPDDQIANLNAANVSMKRGDLLSAGKFLSRSGKSAHAKYARGNFEALNHNYEAAELLFEEALAEGLNEAEEALSQLQELMK